MEEVMDFDAWLQAQQSKEISYYAIYDDKTGQILGVYPDHLSGEFTNKVKIETELAVEIINGKINPSSARVNLTSGNFEIIELVNLNRLDFLLHRVPDIRYCEERDNEIFISYNRNLETIKFEMADKFFGTKKTSDNIIKRNTHWSGDTELVFLITEYNDPNIIYQTFSFKIENLVNGYYEKHIGKMPEKFSVFTRRLFRNYILEFNENI